MSKVALKYKSTESRTTDCLRCEKVFGKPYSLYRHLWNCKIDCNPESKISYKEAKNYANPPDYYKCKYCNEIIIDTDLRQNHEKICDKKDLINNIKYSYIKNDSDIIVTEICEKTGFYNATKICVYVKKELKEYFKINSAKNFIKFVEEKNKNNDQDIIFQKPSNSNARNNHIWVHPFIFTHLCCWISSEFFYKVIGWIDISKRHIIVEFYEEISKIKKDDFISKEKEIQDILSKTLNGKKEVKTIDGYIDIMTELEIIEIKHIDDYKHAVGQIIFYGDEYPDKQKRIHLFSEEDIEEEKKEHIKSVCDKYNIEVTYEIILI
jgi:KilA-N domain